MLDSVILKSRNLGVLRIRPHKIPIIGVTGRVEKDIVHECIMEAGMDEVLTKPLFLPDVDAAIARWQETITARKNS